MELKTIQKLHIFISCPSDVEVEKDIVEEVCVQLSETLRKNKSIELCPIHWKKEVVPLITGEGPQSEINRQVEGYDYDIYIGIMWKRFGDQQSNGLTPTQEEFQIALNTYNKQKRPLIQFYFKRDEFTPSNDYEKLQSDSVQRFKDEIRELGITSDFEGAEAFRKQLERYLVRIVDEFDSLTAQDTEVPQTKYPPVESYLPRKVCDINDYSSNPYICHSLKKTKDLRDVIMENKHVALLSDAGVGKTTELERIASQFSKAESLFWPYIINLNKYVNQSVSDLLPIAWIKVSESRLLVILDGLDEIESKNKNDAIRQIELFSEQHPKAHILVSCRANFFESETHQFSGTLKSFSSYILLPLRQEEITQYVDNILREKAQSFHVAISNNQLYDLLVIPFYLVHIVQLFKEENALPGHKAELFEHLLKARIKLDLEHFRNTTDLKQKQHEIIQSVQRLALAMEIIGRNYIDDSEYRELIDDDSLRELIEHSTFWKKDDTDGLKWQFEHNNFQEFLAAKLLSDKPPSNVKKLMFFGSDYRKLIPSWSNTLSFLISISENQYLISWIIKYEPELAVKFEPDKIDIEIRVRIFKEIFNHYKEKQIWINRDKFHYGELARFGQSDESVEFILRQAEKAEHYTTTSNAIEILSHLQIPSDQTDRTCSLLANCAITNKFSDQVQTRALLALADLGLGSSDVVDEITKAIKSSDSEWVRYGLYYFLHNSDCLDDNIDIFLDGIKYIKLNLSSERSRLMDEHWNLRIGLEKAKTPTAIKKILEHFITHPQDISDIVFEKTIPVIAENAANACSQDSSLFSKARELFEVLIDKHLKKQAEKFLTFFDKTNSRFQIFKDSLINQKDNRELWEILSLLADADCIEFFVKQYEADNLEDDDILIFRNYLIFKKPELYSLFNDLINKRTNNKFPLPVQRDYGKEGEDRLQRDIDSIFDKQRFLDEVKLIFVTEGKQSLTRQEVVDIQQHHWDNPYYSDLAINQLRDLSKTEPVTVDNITSKVNAWDWDWFCICKIYDKLDHDDNVVLTDDQIAFIEGWCYSNMNNIDFKTALVTKPDNSFSSSWLAVFLWYFLRKFDFAYPKEILLDLLSYDWLGSGHYVGIEYLEALLSKHEMTSRILANLEAGIENGDVLENHFSYCKRHNIIEVLPYAMTEIANSNRQDQTRRISLDVVCELSKTLESDLEKVLPEITDSIKWDVIKKLMPNSSQICHKYLVAMFRTANDEDMLKAAYHLVQLQDLKGLKFLVNWIKKNKHAPEFWRHDKSPLLSLRTFKAIPYLIELLDISYRPDFKKNNFHNLGHYVLDAFNEIALVSDKNYKHVRKAITKYIDNNIGKIENVNFLNSFIESLEQKYFISKSESLTIADVKQRLKIIEKDKGKFSQSILNAIKLTPNFFGFGINLKEMFKRQDE